MSSTNRSKARDLHIADYYVTPIPVIERKNLVCYSFRHGASVRERAGNYIYKEVYFDRLKDHESWLKSWLNLG